MCIFIQNKGYHKYMVVNKKAPIRSRGKDQIDFVSISKEL